jgi:hypothetical protein
MTSSGGCPEKSEAILVNPLLGLGIFASALVGHRPLRARP